MAIQHQHITAGGVRLHVAETGDGPPLILLHGWPEFWATWEPVMARLADRFRLIAPDFRGFGESDNPSPEPTDQAGADVLADDILALMDALSLEQAGFVGHDIGAYVMQSLARRHPKRASCLLFFNCPTHGVGARWRDPGHINEIWYQTFHQMPYAADIVGASRESCRAHIGHFLRHWSHRKDAFDGVLERWVDNFMRPGTLQGGFNFYISQNAPRLQVMAGTAPSPEKIKVPARVVWGRHDPILKAEWADVLPEAFEEVSVDIAEDCGHFVHYENPDRAAEEITAFFK
ncbi:MAG: alpha/beta hydrolase [Alphaproteobacteria bacterium]|nr:alpha/beta hydrolase [Alphaproteobacteria bacterium]